MDAEIVQAYLRSFSPLLIGGIGDTGGGALCECGDIPFSPLLIGGIGDTGSGRG